MRHQTGVDRETATFNFRRDRVALVQVADSVIEALFLIRVPKLLMRQCLVVLAGSVVAIQWRPQWDGLLPWEQKGGLEASAPRVGVVAIGAVVKVLVSNQL